ncbi:MAG: sigma factor, partial [Solirubrobacterales bacterium]
MNTATAEDLAAETFLIALRQASRFDPERGGVRPWLFGVATNLLRREFRRETREFRAYARSGVDPIDEDAIEDADQRMDAQRFQPNLAGGLA